MIERQCVEDCVYWGNPTPNGTGGYTFDDPVELKCRWEQIEEVLRDDKGNEKLSRVSVWLLQDVDEEGYLYRGTLDDSGLPSNPDDPRDIDGAEQIISFRKIPCLGSATDFIRRANLNMEGGRTI